MYQNIDFDSYNPVNNRMMLRNNGEFLEFQNKQNHQIDDKQPLQTIKMMIFYACKYVFGRR